MTLSSASPQKLTLLPCLSSVTLKQGMGPWHCATSVGSEFPRTLLESVARCLGVFPTCTALMQISYIALKLQSGVKSLSTIANPALHSSTVAR